MVIYKLKGETMAQDRKEYLKLYYREWRKKNKEKAKTISERYWKKRLNNETKQQEHIPPLEE